LEEKDLRGLDDSLFLLLSHFGPNDGIEFVVVFDFALLGSFLRDFGVTIDKIKRRHAEKVVISDRDVTCKSLFVLGLDRHCLSCVTTVIEKFDGVLEELDVKIDDEGIAVDVHVLTVKIFQLISPERLIVLTSGSLFHGEGEEFFKLEFRSLAFILRELCGKVHKLVKHEESHVHEGGWIFSGCHFLVLS
jgi:hypothetical protein